jgi:hypothetical protein
MKKKPRGKPFKKGELVPSPCNQGRLTPEERELKKLEKGYARSIFERYTDLPLPNLKEIYSQKDELDLPSIEMMAIKMIIDAIVLGEIKKSEWIFAQRFGKLRETVKEEKVITLKFQDKNGNEVTQEKFKELSTDDLHNVVSAMLKDE